MEKEKDLQQHHQSMRKRVIVREFLLHLLSLLQLRILSMISSSSSTKSASCKFSSNNYFFWILTVSNSLMRSIGGNDNWRISLARTEMYSSLWILRMKVTMWEDCEKSNQKSHKIWVSRRLCAILCRYLRRFLGIWATVKTDFHSIWIVRNHLRLQRQSENWDPIIFQKFVFHWSYNRWESWFQSRKQLLGFRNI